MTTIRNQNIAIPNADDVCSLDLKLACPNGEDIFIPFGVVETQTKEEQKPPEQQTSTIAIEPRIFNEASLDKAKATTPDFIENIEGIPANATCGYIYIFVDGYLWREVACTGNGMFSDVDLMQEHSKDIREHHSSVALNIIIPTKTKSLYNGESLAPVVIEIAFSRVQWSWQYINDLGGMFATDKRFSLSPLLSKCLDDGRATRLREERCQKLDFTQKENPIECEFLYEENGNSIVYLHDMVGIAQRYHVLLEHIVTLLNILYQKAKQHPYYDSAMLAHSSFFSGDLHEKKWDVTNKNSFRPEYTNQSGEANTLRSTAAKLDDKAIEAILISPQEISLLEQYLDLREELANFLNHDYDDDSQMSTLTEISDASNIHAATEWQVAMRDLSTLPISAYHTGLTAVYNILNSLTQPMSYLPIYVKGLAQENIDDRERLTERMAEVEAKTDEIAQSLSNNDDSWFLKQFCAAPNAFGKDMKNAAAEPEPIIEGKKDEPGIFDPNKLKQAMAKADEDKNSVGDLLVIGLKSLKASSSLTIAMLSFWKSNLKLTSAPSDQSRIINMIGPSLKSTGIDIFKHIEFANFGEVPDGYIMVGSDITENTLFSNARLHPGRKALQRVQKAIDTGKPIAQKDIKTLEKYASYGTHTSSNDQKNTIVIDRKTGDTVAVNTRSGLRSTIQKIYDVKGLLTDLRTIKMTVFIVHKSKVPDLLAYPFNEENPLRKTHGIDLNKVAKRSKMLHKALPGSLFLLDSLLTISYYNNYTGTFKDKGEWYEKVKNLAVLAELAVSGAQVYESYISSQNLMSHALFVDKAEEINERLKPTGHGIKITRLIIAGGVIGVVGGALMIIDAWFLMEKNDKDAAIAGYIAGGLATLLGATAIVGLSGPLVWALLLGTLVFSVISGMLINSDTQNYPRCYSN